MKEGYKNVFVDEKENYIYHLARRRHMSTDSINLKGLLLHSPEARMGLSRHFYQALLGKTFKLEQHDQSQLHYFSWIENLIIELYPSPEKIVSSFALQFLTTDIDSVLQRMKGSSFQPKAVHDRKNVTYSDPEDRNVRLHGVESDAPCLRLDEVALHTQHPVENRAFYQLLLEMPFTEQSYGDGQVPFYSARSNDVTLKLWPDNLPITPSPSLFFTCSDLAQVRSRMGDYSKDWKQINDVEARLLDRDERKIILYQR